MTLLHSLVAVLATSALAALPAGADALAPPTRGAGPDASRMRVLPHGGTAAQPLASLTQEVGLTPQMFGAKGDATTDDTAALQAWAAAVTPGTALTCPAGTYLFKAPILFPSGMAHVSVKCSGSLFVYAGSSTTIDLLQVGSSVGDCSDTDWVFEDFGIKSVTRMTAGDGFRLNDLCASDVRNVSAGKDLNGDGKLWNGLHFNGGNNVHYAGPGASGQNAALIVNGDAATQFTDFWIDKGVFLGSRIGIEIGGNVGGFEMISGDALENEVNVQVDRSQVDVANAQIFFGANVAIDVTTGGLNRGVYVTDPGSGNSLMFLSGTWVASASDTCVYFETAARWIYMQTGGTLYNCKASGFYSTSPAVTANISGTLIGLDGNYGLLNGRSVVTTCGVTYMRNTPGNTYGPIGSSC